jgi:hypothetical protein
VIQVEESRQQSLMYILAIGNKKKKYFWQNHRKRNEDAIKCRCPQLKKIRAAFIETIERNLKDNQYLTAGLRLTRNPAHQCSIGPIHSSTKALSGRKKETGCISFLS